MMSRFLSPLGDTISKTSGYSILGHPVITQINCYEDAESIFLFYNFLSLTDVRRDAEELQDRMRNFGFYLASNVPLCRGKYFSKSPRSIWEMFPIFTNGEPFCIFKTRGYLSIPQSPTTSTCEGTVQKVSF